MFARLWGAVVLLDLPKERRLRRGRLAFIITFAHAKRTKNIYYRDACFLFQVRGHGQARTNTLKSASLTPWVRVFFLKNDGFGQRLQRNFVCVCADMVPPVSVLIVSAVPGVVDLNDKFCYSHQRDRKIPKNIHIDRSVFFLERPGVFIDVASFSVQGWYHV